MVAKLNIKNASKQNDALGKMLQKELLTIKAELNQQLEDSLKAANDDMQAQFASLAANIASAFAGGKVNAHNLANAAAQSFVPVIKDYFNKSLAQQGDDMFGLLNNAQRNM